MQRAGLSEGLVRAPPHLGIALVVGACWAALGVWLIERFAEQSRRDGSITLDE